jgi:membrane-associated phospholipid phosphatase
MTFAWAKRQKAGALLLVDQFVDLGSPQSAETRALPGSKLQTEETGFEGSGPRPDRSLLWLGLVFLVTGGLAFWLDRPTSQIFVGAGLPNLLEELFRAAEPFGNGFTVAVLLITLAKLVPSVRARLPRVALIAFGSGILVNVIKLLVPRLRPRHFDLEQTIWQSFEQAMLATERSGAIESFPSGHTATAFGLAIGLSWLWPEGRPVFWTLAVLVGLQRIVSGAHFLSDVLIAAALSCFLGAVVTSPHFLGGRLSRLERSWEASREGSRRRAGYRDREQEEGEGYSG